MKKRNNKRLATALLAATLVGPIGVDEFREKPDQDWKILEDTMALSGIRSGVACKTRKSVVTAVFGAYYLGFGTTVMLEAMIDSGECFMIKEAKFDKIHRILQTPDGTPLILVTFQYEGKTLWGIYMRVPTRAKSPKGQDASIQATTNASEQQRAYS